MNCSNCEGDLATERYTLDPTPTEISAGGHYTVDVLCDFCAPGVWRVNPSDPSYRYRYVWDAE